MSNPLETHSALTYQAVGHSASEGAQWAVVRTEALRVLMHVTA